MQISPGISLISSYGRGPFLPKVGLLAYWRPAVDIIGVSSGPVQPGRGYTGDGVANITIAGLLTTDVIISDSTAIPTCTTNGILDISDTDTIYGVTITRAGEQIAYYPCAEGSGTVCINSIANVPFSLPNGAISDATIHTEIVDGTGFDLNQDGFSDTENLSLHSNPESGTWTFGANANPVDTGDGWQVDIVDTWVVRQGARTEVDLFAEGDVVNFSYSLKAPVGQSGTVKVRDATGRFTPSTHTIEVTDQYDRYTVQRTVLAGDPTYADPGIYLGGTLSKVIFKDIQTHKGVEALFVNTIGEAVPAGFKPPLSGGRSATSGVIVALGDSITGNDWPLVIDDMLPNKPTVIDSGVAGNTIRQMIDRLDADVFAFDPVLIAVLAGINNVLGGGTLADLKSDYEELISIIAPRTPSALLLSLTPCKGSADWTTDKQAIIDSFNAWLPGIAVDYGCNYKDIYTPLEDPATPDTLLPAYQGGDWLHHSPAGVFALTQAIESGLPGTRVAVDSISNISLQYPGRLKYSLQGVGPYYWPNAPEIIAILGISNAIYDISGVPIEFATTALAKAALDSLADDIYLFAGPKGEALYNIDKSADADRINRYLGNVV